MAGKSSNTIVKLNKKIKDERFKKKVYQNWIKADKNTNTIERSLIKKGYKKIALYGMGETGKLLYSELKGSGIDVLFGIDKKKNKYGDLDIYGIDEVIDFDHVEAVIITVFYDEYSIYESIRQEYDGKILWIQDLIHVEKDK